MTSKEQADIRNRLYQMFLSSGLRPNSAVKRQMDYHRSMVDKYEKAKNLLEADLKAIQTKPLYPDGVFKDSEARVKETDSVLVKLFNKAWYENDYDLRILHSSLSIPLLKKLAFLGDKKAILRLKESIATRIASRNFNTIIFNLNENN